MQSNELNMKDIRVSIRDRVLERLDMTGDIDDEKVMEEIDECILSDGRLDKLPVRARISLRSEVFNSMRRYDILSELLEDDEISEIMINGYNKVFIEKSGRIFKTDKEFESNERLMSVVQSIVSGANRLINETRPIADAVMPDGSRINVVLSGVSKDGTAVTVRKFPEKVITMDKLIEKETISEEASELLRDLVRARYNILITGATATGKTTFLNALSEYIPADERIITIEDSAELRLSGVENLVRLETRNMNVEGENGISIKDLIKTSLRMRPDRIIVGEVRDESVIYMIQAMNTGHDGSLCTAHANSVKDSWARLEMMFLMGISLPVTAIRQQMAAAIDIVVHLGRLRDGSRRVKEISEVIGVRNGEIITRKLFEFVETGESDGYVKGRLMKRERLMHVGKMASAGLMRGEGA